MTNKQTPDHFRDTTQKVEMTPEQAALEIGLCFSDNGKETTFDQGRALEIIQAQREQAVREYQTENTQLKALVAACVKQLVPFADAANWKTYSNDGLNQWFIFNQMNPWERPQLFLQQEAIPTAQQHDEAVRAEERERIIALLDSCKVSFPVQGHPDYVYDVDYLDNQKAIKAIEGGEG